MYSVLSEVKDLNIPAVIQLIQNNNSYDMFIHSAKPFIGGERADDWNNDSCEVLGQPCYYTAPNWFRYTQLVVRLWETEHYDEVAKELSRILTEFCSSTVPT